MGLLINVVPSLLLFIGLWVYRRFATRQFFYIILSAIKGGARFIIMKLVWWQTAVFTTLCQKRDNAKKEV